MCEEMKKKESVEESCSCGSKLEIVRHVIFEIADWPASSGCPFRRPPLRAKLLYPKSQPPAAMARLVFQHQSQISSTVNVYTHFSLLTRSF